MRCPQKYHELSLAAVLSLAEVALVIFAREVAFWKSCGFFCPPWRSLWRGVPAAANHVRRSWLWQPKVDASVEFGRPAGRPLRSPQRTDNGPSSRRDDRDGPSAVGRPPRRQRSAADLARGGPRPRVRSDCLQTFETAAQMWQTCLVERSLPAGGTLLEGPVQARRLDRR